jgi:hypothetical protein
MNFGFLNLITIIFVIGKLVGLFHFSWHIVFMPTVVNIVMILMCFLTVAIIALIDVAKED